MLARHIMISYNHNCSKLSPIFLEIYTILLKYIVYGQYEVFLYHIHLFSFAGLKGCATDDAQ